MCFNPLQLFTVTQIIASLALGNHVNWLIPFDVTLVGL